MGLDFVFVVFDILSFVVVNNVDVVIIDIVGWFYNKVGLMNEFIKIKNVMKKVVVDVFYEVLLVLDGFIG